MKPAGLLLFIPAGFVAVLAAEENSTGLVSKELKARIREGLPTWHPPSPKTEGTPGTDGTGSAGDVLVLPKMTVKKLRLPPDAEDYLMSKDEFKRKMENIYLDEVAKDGPLNYLLNSFTIPILSPSKAERGRAIYRAREVERLNQAAEVGKMLDPESTKKLKQNMDNTWTTRPAGELRGRSDLHGGKLP